MYRVHVLNLRNTYQFTPRFFVRAVAQFDSSRKRVLGDFLASYELSPGTVLHAGYGSLFGREIEGRQFDRYTRDGARAFHQGVLPGALLIAATSLPAFLAIAPVRMEQRGMIERAQRAHVNLLRRDARARELVARRAP